MASEPNAQAYPLYIKGVEAYNAKNNPTAYRALIAACDADPTYSGTWWYIGLLLHEMRRYAQAASAFVRALACFELGVVPRDRAKVLSHMAWNQHCAGQHTEAWMNIQRARAVDPEFHLAWMVSSQIEVCMGDGKRAIESAQRALVLDPDWSIELQLGFAYMSDGQLLEGLKHYHARFVAKIPHVAQYGYPFWDGGHVDTLLIESEQGLGDAIQYMRFIPEAASRVGKAVYLAHKEMYRLSSHALAGVPNLEVVAIPAALPLADAFAGIVSLPLMLKTDMLAVAENFKPPYVGSGVRKVSSSPLKIGIAWAGNPTHDNDRLRSIPVETFLPLCEMSGVRLFSLQVGSRGGDLNECGMYGFVADLSPHLIDIQATADVMENLDLIVTVDTALLHLAGAMEKPCFALINQHGRDFRWGPLGDSTPWYSSVRLFRRGLYETWADVMRRVADAVRKFPKSGETQ